MGRKCSSCKIERIAVQRPKTGQVVCRGCFFEQFEREIHETIVDEKLFARGDRVAIGASGGKDSTVLAYLLVKLNKEYDYGLDLFLLSVDEGISGYRDDSIATVKRNEIQYGIPLKIVTYSELYGRTMDEIVAKIGKKSNCTYCGVYRRRALDVGASKNAATKVATGHNADDLAETVLLNVLRNDFSRLKRCTNAITGKESDLPRVKPFKHAYQKEIVLYAFFKNLDYFATECIYSPDSHRSAARELLSEVSSFRKSATIDVINAAEEMKFPTDKSNNVVIQGECERCGYITSQRLCKACVLTEGLANGEIVHKRSKKGCS